MNKWFLLLTLIIPIAVFSQVSSVISFDKNENDFKIQGNFVKGINWSDKLGDNYLVLSATQPFEKIKGSRKLDAELYAYHFIKTGGNKKQQWKMMDSQEACPAVMDITVRFITEGTAITDLNKNGVAEAWLIYKMGCRTDVSPAKMKIVMYEGDKIYIVNGRNRVPHLKGKPLGGEMEMDANFKNGPEEFRKYALKLWGRFIDEDYK